jgi:hypothetical protein
MWHVWEKGEVHTGFWCVDRRERDHLKKPGRRGGIILKYIFKKWDVSMEWINLAQGRVR